MVFRKCPGRRLPLVLLTILGVLLIGGLALCGGCGSEKKAAALYHCPMHPTYVSDRPGDCPICGMRLVPIEAGAPAGGEGAPADTGSAASSSTSATGGTAPLATGSSGAGARRVLFYRSPMDPAVTSLVPAKDSMGMDFVPVYAEEASPADARGAAGGVPGLAAVVVDTTGLRLAGVRTAVARREPFARVVRAAGFVKADETRVRRVQTRVAGYVERLQASFTGQAIRAGQPVLSLYSPELLSAQEEYLRAREAAARFAASSLPEVRHGGEDLLQAARRRLELLEVPEAFIAGLEKTGRPERDVTFTAPVSGYITAKEVLVGQRVEPGMELFTVTDLGTVWVEAAFYESEASAIAVGAPAVLTLPYDPAVTLQGRVAYVYPYLNADTRTLPVRFDVPNPGLALKPGMFVNVELRVDQGEQVVVPADAVMDTGERQVVFVAGPEGRFTPRQVVAGARADGRVAVLSGLATGEQVAVQANFLLDSESRLRAAIAGAGSGAGAAAGTAAEAAAGPAALDHRHAGGGQ